MDALIIAQKLREIWDNYENVHARLIEIATDIELYGECSEHERLEIEELRNECEDIAVALDAILQENDNAS